MNIRSAFRVAIFGALALCVGSGIVNAGTVFSTVSAGGILPDMTAPPNPNTTGSASFAQFNFTTVNAAIQSSCPAGFTCSGASLYQIDLGMQANTDGLLTINNSNSTSQQVGCIGGICNGAGVSATSGVAADGTLTLLGYDPLSNLNPVVGVVNATAFTVNTNTLFAGNAVLTVGTGATPFSGTGSATDPLAEVYGTNESNLTAAVLSAYTGAGNVSIGLTLTGASQFGSAPAGVSSSGNIDEVSSGTVNAEYFYSYTETQIGGAPEPATLFLMGSALVGIGLLRKRVKS
jgi:hypothetical protein